MPVDLGVVVKTAVRRAAAVVPGQQDCHNVRAFHPVCGGVVAKVDLAALRVVKGILFGFVQEGLPRPPAVALMKYGLCVDGCRLAAVAGKIQVRNAQGIRTAVARGCTADQAADALGCPGAVGGQGIAEAEQVVSHIRIIARRGFHHHGGFSRTVNGAVRAAQLDGQGIGADVLCRGRELPVARVGVAFFAKNIDAAPQCVKGADNAFVKELKGVADCQIIGACQPHLAVRCQKPFQLVLQPRKVAPQGLPQSLIRNILLRHGQQTPGHHIVVFPFEQPLGVVGRGSDGVVGIQILVRTAGSVAVIGDALHGRGARFVEIGIHAVGDCQVLFLGVPDRRVKNEVD